MASDAETAIKASKKDKKEKKEKKEKKRSESDGVHKSKKDKKDKKTKKDKLAKALEDNQDALTAALDEKLQQDAAKQVKMDLDEDSDAGKKKSAVAKKTTAVGDLVPFALPLADEHGHKKILKSVRKAARAGALKRGLKEVNKALHHTPDSEPGVKRASPGVCVIAGDVWPMDVISHLPILCEDKAVPYVFVRERVELGAASLTKRATSVAMVMETARKRKPAAAAKDAVKDAAKPDDDEDAAAEWKAAYKELVKYVSKESNQLMPLLQK